MDEPNPFRLLVDIGVVRLGHFVYQSWRHGDTFLNMEILGDHEKEAEFFARELARPFSVLEYPVGVVIGANTGKLQLHERVARHLSKFQGNKVLSFCAMRDARRVSDDNDFIIDDPRQHLIRDQKVLLVDDVLTTGGTLRKMLALNRTRDGQAIGVGVICNRSGLDRPYLEEVPRFEAVVEMELETYQEDECLLCAIGTPINTDVGHGREFLAQRKN